MPYHLPTLSRSAATTREDLIRFYHRVELHWARHLAEETALDVGTALVNPALPQANCIFDAALPQGLSPAQAVEQVNAHFRDAGAVCQTWVMNPSAPVARAEPLAEHLMALGYTQTSREILYLQGAPPGPIAEVSGLTIIPARASFRHARLLAADAAPQSPAAVEAAILHLDDPHVDSLLVLRDGAALAQLTVLSVGEIGAITELFVLPAYRRQRIGRTLLSRALEIAARSLFKYVFTAATADNIAAQALFGAGGFVAIGTFTEYIAPSCQTFA